MPSIIDNLLFQDSLTWALRAANAYGPTVNGASFSPSSGTFADGTGAGNVNKVYLNQGSVGGGGNLTLDLTALTDPLGAALNFSLIKAIWFEILETTAPSSVTFAATVANSCIAWGIPLYSGARFTWLSPAVAGGITVTDTTADQLKILNNDGGVAANYRMLLAGT